MRSCRYKHAHERMGHCGTPGCENYVGTCPTHRGDPELGAKCTIPRWSVEFEDDTRQGFWYLADDQRWDDRHVAAGLTKEELEYAASLLNNDYLDDEGCDLTDFEDLIFEMVAKTACRVCEQTKYAPELDGSGRCLECQS